ncbi:hypothetical protein AB0G97_34660 [Streptomyces sp. NPDC020755]|uniref:hypothetical protein n=1 Tax=Streptomyces sp. NPDC020755 TaxID=3154790 RepID=UPI002F3EC09D
MGRHSLPDSHAREGRRDHPGPRRRRRTVAIATLLVLTVATGTAVAAKVGLLSFSRSCEETAVRLTVAASPDIAPAVRSIAEQAPGSVASSPVALAMVPSASRKLGWPEKSYSWSALVAALGSDRVHLGAADPARSATGLLALVGIGASSARPGCTTRRSPRTRKPGRPS